MPGKAKRTRKRGGGAGRAAAAQAVFQALPEKVFTSREPVIRRRLLLVEEDRHNIDELRDVFTERGYECEVALDLKTARNILTERMMDLTVVNAGIPDINDEEIIREFRERDRSMSLVIYNGTKDKARQRKLRSMGAASYLSTTSDLKAVAKSVVRVLTTRR
jgi:DNA-binding NtrC family response regulator